MSKLVVKDTALMNASYNLDLVEHRLILLAIVEARESGKGINANDPLTIHADSYVQQFGVTRQTAYQSLKDACDDLFARQFSYQELNERGNIENIRSRWVSEIRYVDREATVKLIFAPAIIPLITRLERRFTDYEMHQVSSLSSGYAVRMYELLICWRSTGKTPFIELQDLRSKLGILENEYHRMHDFKKRIIEPSLKKINEHTDITATYEQRKLGRTITDFSFSFQQKKQVDKKTDKPKKASESLNNTWNTAENSMFKTLYDKCPTLTKTYVEELAKTKSISIHELLTMMFMEHASVDAFELKMA